VQVHVHGLSAATGIGDYACPHVLVRVNVPVPET